MKKKIISHEQYKVSEWSGGKTTEVFLHPPEGHYKVTQFDFRLSTAEVLLEETTFSKLPGYQRIIMSLDNPLSLSHEGRNGVRKVTLAPYQTDFFSGDEKTTSIGKCTDFNLIFSPDYYGEMKTLSSGGSRKLIANVSYFYYALDALSIMIHTNDSKERVVLKKQECLLVDGINEDSSIEVFASSEKYMPVLVEVTVR